MKKLTYSIISLLVALCIMGCMPKRTEKEGLLWKITGNGLKAPSYLFGTYHGSPHFTDSLFLDSVPCFHTVFESVQQLILEMPVSLIKSDEFKQDMKERVMLPAGTSYSDLLSAEDLAILDSTFLQTIGCTSSEVNARPSIMMTALSQIMTAKKAKEGASEEQLAILAQPSMDYALETRGIKRNYTIVGLDDMDVINLASFSDSDMVKEAKMLMTFVKRTDSDAIIGDSLINVLVAAYRTKDMKEIEKVSLSLIEYTRQELKEQELEEQDDKDVFDKLIEGRNEKWMKKLPQLMADKSSFIAVGVRHLPTEVGLIHMLRQQGYTVEAMK